MRKLLWRLEPLTGLDRANVAEDQRQRSRRVGESRLARSGGQGIAYDDICEAAHNFLAAAEFDRACGLALQIGNFHIERQQTIAAVAWASDVLQRLPSSAENWAPLADIEVQGSRQLGLTNRALLRARQIAQVFERRVQQEPGRADYQRDLCLSLARCARSQGSSAVALAAEAAARARDLQNSEPERISNVPEQRPKTRPI